MMDKTVFLTVLGGDEPEALRVVKPLDCAGGAHLDLLLAGVIGVRSIPYLPTTRWFVISSPHDRRFRWVSGSALTVEEPKVKGAGARASPFTIRWRLCLRSTTKNNKPRAVSTKRQIRRRRVWHPAPPGRQVWPPTTATEAARPGGGQTRPSGTGPGSRTVSRLVSQPS